MLICPPAPLPLSSAQDIKRFLALLGVNMLGFGLCVAGISLSAGIATEPDAFDILNKAYADELAAAGAQAAASSSGREAPLPSALLEAEPTSPWEPFLMPFWAIFGISMGYDEKLLTIPRPLSALLWVYFLLSQVVLLNLLVAIMGDTWQRVKESADEEWKFLLVQDMEEFFMLHPVPPPFGALILLRRIHSHLALGAHLTDGNDARRSPLLTTSDIKKKSKVAQHDLLIKQAAAEAETYSAKLTAMMRTQQETAERLEKLKTDSAYVTRAVDLMQHHVVARAGLRGGRSPSGMMRSPSGLLPPRPFIARSASMTMRV